MVLNNVVDFSLVFSVCERHMLGLQRCDMLCCVCVCLRYMTILLSLVSVSVSVSRSGVAAEVARSEVGVACDARSTMATAGIATTEASHMQSRALQAYETHMCFTTKLNNM
jgi:hypothetical protein